ncbi:hypothetical protein WA026_022624 [Henosepilachna vigintioctopunctata]|uniref:Uncharacterized protein n=1 Tax=Henosepilachna vigintioctopunctata TaxID=420089 RepID=A0AAW1UEI6_9CUCU
MYGERKNAEFVKRSQVAAFPGMYRHLVSWLRFILAWNGDLSVRLHARLCIYTCSMSSECIMRNYLGFFKAD